MTTRISPSTKHVWFDGQRRTEHWYRDNQVYFITARCREKTPAFCKTDAQQVFWDRFLHYTHQYDFTPFVTSLMSNHYHTIGYLKIGENLGPMMQRLHGSVASQVNKVLRVRLLPFWSDKRHKTCFDGCIRSEKQCRLAYLYTLTQCRRHRICDDPADYENTRVNVELEHAIQRASELKAFLTNVTYKRYLMKQQVR